MTIPVRVEGHPSKDFSDLCAAWAYLNGFFQEPVGSLLFSINGQGCDMGDLTWRALCGSPDRLSLFLGCDEADVEDDDHGF